MNMTTFNDLRRLTQKRTRDAATLTLQLLDDDGDRISMLMACAIDFINGAAEFVRQHSEADGEPITKEEALGHTLNSLIAMMGERKVINAIKKSAEGRASK